MKPPANPPGNCEWRLTEDQSWTLHDPEFQESMHGRDGAWSETRVRYIEGCELERQWQESETLNLLDVGVGIGTGLVATLNLQERLKRAHPEKNFKLHYVGLELKEELIVWLIKDGKSIFRHLVEKDVLEKCFNKIELLAPNTNYQFEDINTKIEIIIGDAKETFPRWQLDHHVSFHAIFQDAYSPKNNPNLWDELWFTLLRKNIQDQGILSTFSAATKVKQSLLSSNWEISDGPLFGHKRGSTVARPKII